MSLNDFSNVVVSAEGPALSQVGFGTIGIAAYHTKNADYSREYTLTSQAADDGFKPYEPAYRMIQEAFSQSPRPTSVKVLRLATPPVQTNRLTPLAVNGAEYAITIEVDGHAPQDISVTADSSATVDEICDALETAINTAFTGVTVGTSTTSLAVGTGSKTFTTQTDLFLPVGTPIVATSVLGSDSMTGTVTSYNEDTGALVVNVASVTGSGTDTDWTLTATYLTVTPSGGTATYLDLVIPTSRAAGGTFRVRNWRHDRIQFEDRTPNPGVAADLDAIRAADDSWYGLATACNSNAYAQVVAGWAEAQLVLYATVSSDTRSIDTAVTTDLWSVLHSLSYKRTRVLYDFDDSGGLAGVGCLAERFPFDPGIGPDAGGTFNAKTIRGITSDDLTPSQKANLNTTKKYVVYIDTAGRAHQLGNGGADGTPFDQTRFVDWFVTRLQDDLAAVQLNNGRVPYDERGLAVLEAACRKRVQIGLNSGGISPRDADGNAPSVIMPKMSDTTQQERAARELGGGGIRIKFKYAGAIEKANVGITVVL